MAADRETEILDLINAAMHQATARMQRSLRDERIGLAAMEARTLRFIARHPGCTQNDIVVASGRDKAQIARIIKSLLEHGFVARLADQPGQKRQRLELTDAGAAPHAQAETLRARVAKDLVEGLDDAERAQLLGLLQRMPLNAATEQDHGAGLPGNAPRSTG